MEQFIEAIHLVQSGHGSHSPEDCSPVTEEDNSSDISIDDIWIGPEVAAADNSLDNFSPDNGRDDTESSVATADNSLDNTSSNYGGDEAESSASATETLINLDPAHYFNWFVATSHFGVGIFSEIYTAQKLRAPGTSVHYFTTFDEAKQHFDLALAVWCVISGEYLVNIWGISGEYPAGREQRHPQQKSVHLDVILSIICLSRSVAHLTPNYTKNTAKLVCKANENIINAIRLWNRQSLKLVGGCVAILMMHCYAYLLHKQDIVALFRTLDQLSTELGYKSGVPEARTLQSRVIAVLQRVSDEGWSVVCRDALPSYMMRCNNLSQELVDLMGRQLAVEKEVILIIDEGGVEAYDEAMLSDSLSWHWIIPNSPGEHRRGDSEVPLETTEFDFTTLDDFPNNLQNDTPEFVEFAKQGTVVQGEVLRSWRADTDLYLEEFLRLEGRGDYSQDLCVCGEEAPIYRCQDCYGPKLFCHLQPLHKIKRWDGISFHDITLKSMGIRLQLGHTSHSCCDNPLPAFSDELYHHRLQQYLRSGTIQEFMYRRIVTEAMLRMMREWRFIKQMQRAGQGHHPKGIAATEPGKNLPDGWDSAPSENTHFFVEEQAYKSFIGSQERLSRSHDAVNLADTRVSRCGLRPLVPVLSTAREHNFKQPLLSRRLTKGERYQHGLPIFSEHAVFSRSHVAKCHDFLFLQFHQKVLAARMVKPRSLRDTREMGPGSRRDTLDDHFNDWNWKKICAMGSIFHRKYNFALIEVQERVDDLNDFEASLATD
ncbi:hypothetical protein EDB19DRAFT_1831477, partial [Suillus lakei]